MHLKAGRLAFKVALIYVIVAGGWVVFSGEMVKWLVRNPDESIQIFIIKGLAFVLLTGGLLHLGLRRIMRHWELEAEQRKRAEAAQLATEQKMRRSEEQLRLVLEASAEGVWDWNLKTGVADLSSRYWEIIGHPAGEVVADRDFLKRLVHPEDWPTVEQALNEHFAGASAQCVCEFRAIGKDGTAKWTLVRGRVVARAPDGTPLRMVGTNSDITPRKLAEQQLRESEERYHQLFELESDAVVLVDCETHRFMDVNLAAQQLYGYSREEFLQLTPEDVSDEPEQTREIIGCGYFCVPLRWHRKKNGERFAVEITANQINHHGRLTELATLRDITIRQQTMQKFQETAQQLLAAQRLVRIGSYSYDVATSLWNSSVVLDELFGVADPHFKKDTAGWLQIIHPEDRDEMERYLKNDVVKARTEFDREYRIIRPNDQQVRWVHGLGKLLLDDQGEVAQMVDTIQDITERKRIETKLNYEQNLWQTMLDISPDHIYFKDTESRFIKSSNTQARQFGVQSPDEMVGKTDFDFFAEARARLAFEDEQEIIRTGQPIIDKEERELWKDGHITWASSTKMPMRDDAGKIIGIMGISRDITARKLVEESHTRLATAVEQAAESIVITDVGGTILYVNPAFEKNSGYARAEILGQNPRVLKSGKQDAEFYRRMWTVLRRGEIWRIRFHQLNLLQPPYPFSQLFHVVLCRNVMIYFDRPTQELLIGHLAEQLLPGGYLLVGHSESLSAIKHPLQLIQPAIYLKPEA